MSQHRFRIISGHIRANHTFSHCERSDGTYTQNDRTNQTQSCTVRVGRALSQGFMHIHEHGAECGLSDDKAGAALHRVKKLRRREPWLLPPHRRKQLIAVGCEARIRPALCRSHNASPARLPVMLMKILTCSHLGRSRPTSRVACVTGRRVRGVKRGWGWAAGAGRLPPLRRGHLVDEDVMTSPA